MSGCAIPGFAATLFCMIGMLILPAWALFGLAAAIVARRKGRPHVGITYYLLGPIGLVLAFGARQWFYDPELNITGDLKHLARARSEYEGLSH